MRVFIIPSWHPTPEKPNWCNWIKPHIELTKSIVDDVVVIQVDLESQNNSDEIIELQNNHYYIAAGISKSKYQRTIFCYGKTLKDYHSKLENIFKFAVERHGNPDLIHAHVSMPAGYGAGLLGKKHNIPVIVTEHYSGFFSDNKFPWRLRSFYRKMRNNIDGFYTVSPGFKDHIENRTDLRVDGVLPNPINTDLFFPEIQLVKKKRLRFITTGNFGLIKGTDILLKAFAALPSHIDWQLTIIGKQDLKNQALWNTLLDELPKDRIKVIDPVPQKKLREIYSQSDVYIVSSRIETANVSMLEAMACGCYVISSKIKAPETLLSCQVANTYNLSVEGLQNVIVEVSSIDLPNRAELRQFVLNRYSYKSLQKKIKTSYLKYLK